MISPKNSQMQNGKFVSKLFKLAKREQTLLLPREEFLKAMEFHVLKLMVGMGAIGFTIFSSLAVAANPVFIFVVPAMTAAMVNAGLRIAMNQRDAAIRARNTLIELKKAKSEDMDNTTKLQDRKLAASLPKINSGPP